MLCFWFRNEDYYEKNEYVKKCLDALNFTWTNSTDESHTFAELSGAASYSDGYHSFLIKLRYFLANDYDRINISLSLENMGDEISDFYYGWVVDEIKVGNDEQNDEIQVKHDGKIRKFPLDEYLNLSFDDLDIKHYRLYDNVSHRALDFWWENDEETPYRLIITSGPRHREVSLMFYTKSFKRGEKVDTNFGWIDRTSWTEEGVCSLSDSSYSCKGSEQPCRGTEKTWECVEDACDKSCPSRPNATASTVNCVLDPEGGHDCQCAAGECAGGSGYCSITQNQCDYTCKPNYEDCNLDTSDGCECSRPSDCCGGAGNNIRYYSCDICAGSSCNNLCDATHCLSEDCGNASYCSSGSCIACPSGYANCNEDATDGCEADLSTDHENCGSCGNKCSEYEICVNGVCTYRPSYVRYRLSFHLGSTKANDVYRVGSYNESVDDLNVTRIVYPFELTHAYVCAYDKTEFSGGLVSGLVHSYIKSRLSYLNFSANSSLTNYTLELKQKLDGSSLLIPFTKGDCQLIDDKMYLVEDQTIPSKAFTSFAYPFSGYVFEILARYDRIQIRGNFTFSKGTHNLCIEKVGISESYKPIVEVRRC